MMNMLRGFAGGYTAKVLIGLLIASFALWGVSGSILAGGNTVVQVGDTKIDTYDFRFAYENQLNQLSRQLQQRLTREQANAFGLQESVLSQVLSGAVLDENTRKMGLGLSNKNIAVALASDPAFQDLSGQFSANTYQSYLRQTGLSEAAFLEDRKKIAMRNQIQQGTSASSGVPQAFLDAMNVYDNEERVFDYAVVTPDSLEKTPEPTDADVSKYYDDNKDSFRAPEYRKTVVLSLEANDLAKPQDVTDADLLATYESRKDNLQTQERRRIQQLVLKNTEEAESVAKQLASGRSFEDMLSELGKTASDLDLGMLRKDELPDEAVRNAAFAAELNKPTAPVSGIFGPVIIRVTEIEEQKTTPFEDIKEQLRNELALQKGGEEVFALYDAIEDERAAGTSVQETADKLELKTRTIDAIDAQGLNKAGIAVSNLPISQQLVQQIFQSEPGDDTQSLPIGNDGYVWYDVVEIIPDRQKELDEVRDDVKAAWVNAEINNQVLALAEGIAKKLRDGGDFNTVLETSLESDSLGQNITYKTNSAIARSEESSDLSAAAIQAGFSGKKGDVQVASNGENQHIILRVSEINAPIGSDIEDSTKAQLDAAASNDILTQVIQDFRSRESVSVNRTAIEQAFVIGQGHGGY